MKKNFRDHHLLCILNEFEAQERPLPLDRFLAQYFKAHKALGSKDRRYICETLYSLVRKKIFLDAQLKQPASWEERLELFQNPPQELESKLKPHERFSLPQELYELICNTHGKKQGDEICEALGEAAPTTLRCNLLKTDRETLMDALPAEAKPRPCLKSDCGIMVEKRLNFFQLDLFREGHFEVQDEGSQLLAELVDIKDSELFLDYCSGSGGKALAVAPKMKGKAQLYLHDVRPSILQEAKKRLRRAGIQNAQTLLTDHPHLKRLKKKMHWTLVDAPCSGSGTLRRNPDRMANISKEDLEELVGMQRNIFEKALSYVRPGGHIIYATCSLFKEENQEQVEHFLKTYPLELDGEPLELLPTPGGHDGFYAARFQRKA